MSQNQGPSLPRSFSGSLKGQLACPNLPRALMSWEGSKSELICYLGEMETERVRQESGLGPMDVLCLNFYLYLTTPFFKERE